MCLAILSLDKRFSNVRPRHPRGGPDGGRDIEALFRGEQRAYAAVGFLNQADDSDEKKKRVRAKFSSDLNSALDAEPRPAVFVFLTNVALTLGEKEDIATEARSNGISFCDIFDRERLRIALDSPDGFGVRFQYLGIPLSDEEQASFFARWGDDINSVITTGFQKVQHTLDQLLFLQEASGPLSSLVLAFELDRTYTGAEIGHFRAFCSLHLKEPKLNTLSLLFGSSDLADRFRTDLSDISRQNQPGISFGISGAQWEQHFDFTEGSPAASSESSENEGDHEKARYKKVGASSSVGMAEVGFLSIRYDKDLFIRFHPVLTLRDLDDSTLPSYAQSIACPQGQVPSRSSERL